MKLKYYGHACFKLDCAEGTLVFDPYNPGSVPGLELPIIEADAAVYSHGHGDHYSPESVRLSGKKPALKLSQIECAHDDKGGTLRGMNLISVVSSEGMKLAHLGDIGEELPEEKLSKLRGLTALLIPVGGFYTIDAEGAKKLIDAVQPRIIVPMHYRLGEKGHQMIAPLEDFLKLFDAKTVHIVNGCELEIKPDTEPGVYVLEM